jgi:Fe-S cluster assembly protein SufD
VNLDTLRASAAAALEKTGFPGPRDEAWKYTPTRGWARRAPLATPRDVDLADQWYVKDDAPRAVFVDGRLDPRWSRLPAGVRSVTDSPALGDVLPGTEGFAASSLADFADGVWVEGCRELVIVHHTTGGGVVPIRHRIEVSGSLALTTVFDGRAGASLAVTGTELIVADDAELRWVDLQDGPAEGHVVHLLAGRIGARAKLAGGLLGIGASVARAEVSLRIGEAADVSLVGLALGGGTRHQDFHTTLHHDGPRSRSAQRFKAILDDTARSVYTGRVIVGAEVPGCDVSQRSAALILSDRAVANARPQLEIHCDDVAASHGSTIGQLDAEALFFLAARGLDREAASALLTTAFANELIDALPVERARGPARDLATSWLGGAE